MNRTSPRMPYRPTRRALMALAVAAVALPAVAATAADWDRWGDAAWSGAQAGVRAWQPQARLVDVAIAGPVASGGRLEGPRLQTPIRQAMQGAGAPAEIAEGFSDAVADAWESWHEAVRVPGLPWYPAFASFPGAQAAPAPNVPTPLAALPSSQAGALAAPALKLRIRSRLGTAAQQPGAEAAIGEFSQRFAGRFASWLPTVMVRGVIGRGPVPSYKPPLVPAGPVVGGKVIDAPGVLASPPF